MTADEAPDLSHLFGPPPDAAERERVERLMRWYAEQSARIEAEARQQMLDWSPVFCTCTPRYTKARPSNRKCVIHAGFMITPDGRVL
jgi:hypothetical protein